MPKVTIVIPTYNSGKTIREALESVENQTFRDWECIVVDGASRDNTIDVIKEYADKDCRFRYISEADRGIYDAFNKGWKLANSPWIHYLGSDDTLTSEGLNMIEPELDENYAVVTGDVYFIRNDGTSRILKSHGFFGCHQGVLMQRCVIEMMGGFDEQYHIIADYDLLVRTSKAGYKSKNVREVLANFNAGGASQKLGVKIRVAKEAYRINKANKVYKFPLLRAAKTLTVGLSSYLYRAVLSLIK